MEQTVETGSGVRILISQNLPPVTFFLSRAAFSKLFQMVPTTEKYCFSDFEAYMIVFCYMNQFMMKKNSVGKPLDASASGLQARMLTQE